jgi:hypothetical protein
MFESLEKHRVKQAEKEAHERIARFEGLGDEVLDSLAAKGLTLNDAAIVLKAAERALNMRGGRVKLADTV